MVKEIPRGLRIIAIFKLLTAFLLAAVSIGLFRLLHQEGGLAIEDFVRSLHLNPRHRLISTAVSEVSGLTSAQLAFIDVGTAFYTLLYLVEGIGLLKAKHWAEYLTIFATALLIPVEIYELVVHTTAPKVIILVVNVAILVYLVWQLHKERLKAKSLPAA